MMGEDRYHDPASNPMIKIRPDDWPPDVEPDEPRPSFGDGRIPLPEKNGKWPGEEKAAAAEEKSEVEPGDFESKVKVFMDKADEVIIVEPVGNLALFKISKRQCGALEVIEPDGSRRSLADLSAEEKKIVDYNLYTKCANGKGDCPCNRI